jgi:hypothetical protein
VQIVLDKLIEVLAAAPDSVLGAGQMGASRPGSIGELPRVVLSLALQPTTGAGLGHFIRTGEQREEIYAERYNGLTHLEVWAVAPAGIDQVARALQTRLRTVPRLLQEKGFLLLQPLALDAAEAVAQQPAVGSPFVAWRQRISYRFVFEAQEGPAPDGGGPIQRIDVDIPQPAESLSIP